MISGMGQAEPEFEQHVIVAGVGLIGGSIAAAVRHRFPDCRVTGVGRNESRLQAAVDAGIIDDFATDYTPELLVGPAIVVICLPVNLIADAACQIAAVAGPDVVITDAGSVKQQICRTISADAKAAARFIGSHPIAGGENGGFEFSDPHLFTNRVCVITPCEETELNASVEKRTVRFWRSLGCRIESMSPAEHDRVLALTSHLPHVVAAALVNSVPIDHLGMTGSGFRDSTRIAAGDAHLWTAILKDNRDSIVSAVAAAEEQLAAFRSALEERRDSALLNLLHDAAEKRSRLNESSA